jgi:hypothetical protein
VDQASGARGGPELLLALAARRRRPGGGGGGLHFGMLLSPALAAGAQEMAVGDAVLATLRPDGGE